MANFVYNKAKQRALEAGLNLHTADVRAMLVSTSTTADTEDDAEFIDDFTVLDEFSGGSYARQALTGEAVALDSSNNRAEFDANNPTFTAINGDVAQALLLYIHVTNDADSWPLAYYDDSPFPVTGNGGDLTAAFNAEGALQAT